MGTTPCAAALAVLALLAVFCPAGHARLVPAARQLLAEAEEHTPAFLEDELPLKVVLTTPTDIASAPAGETVAISGSQALTVVFSRPAIALGSDFGEGSAKGKFPFSLDCPVPGKMRWVTTAIARFDPDIPWVPDLACTLNWDTSFTTYDGVPLQLESIPQSRQLVSEPLQLYSSSVRSDLAQNLTDQQWSASTGMDDDKLPEVPPDGVITLTLASAVNLQMLKDALVLSEKGTAENLGVELTPCMSALPGAELTLDVNATCAELKPKTPLKADTAYSLVLPAGSKYSALSGPLGQEISLEFGGLRRFRIPFKPFTNPYSETSPIYRDGAQYKRLELWLPHGLAEGVTPDQLLPLISVCQYADGFKDDSACTALAGLGLEAVNKGKLLLTVLSGLQPLLRYRISVAASASVKDGFGLPLEASSTTWWQIQVPTAFSGPSLSSTVALLEALPEEANPEDSKWRYIVRPPAKQPKGGAAPSTSDSDSTMRSAAAWSLPFDTDAAVLKIFDLSQSVYDRYLPKELGKPVAEVARDDANPEWQQLALSLPGPSSVHVVHVCCQPIYWPEPHDASAAVQVVMRTNLSFSITQAGNSLTAWVVDAGQGGAAVEGADVLLIARPYNYGEAAFIAGKCTTDADGVCTLDLSNSRGDVSYGAFARKGTQAALLQSSGYFYSSYTAWSATLVLDRLVVVPGDSLKVTGYVQRVAADNSLKLPASMDIALLIEPSLTESASGPTAVTVTLDPESGSVHAEIPIPADAKMANYQLLLRIPKAAPEMIPNAPKEMLPNGARHLMGGGEGDMPLPTGRGVALARPIGGPIAPTPVDAPNYYDWDLATSIGFTVADPRPPTAELKVSAPSWTKPDGAVKVDVAAVSYIGASVDSAEMTLTWSHAQAKGQVVLTTDTNGDATTTIDLSAHNLTAAGDSVSIEVEWIGPTRERIVQDVSVRVEAAPRILSLSRSLDTQLPGIAFGISGQLTSSADSSAVKGVPVSITLKPNATNGPDASSAACSGKELTASCTAPSGEVGFGSCQLALPCPGVFVLEGCAAAGDAPEDGQACANVTLGLTEAGWVEAPWKFHSDPNLWTDKSVYAIGDTAVLSFQNPWPGARALVQWGNTRKIVRKTVFTGLTSGAPASISIALGDECTGGCGLSIVLDVPRQPGAPYPPGQGPIPGVLVSKLFDPLGPHTHSMATRLSIDASNALEVAVNVTGASGTTTDVDGSEVPTVEPGAEAEITIDVKLPGGAAAVDAEVTLYAVDESFLALAPYPLPKPEANMVLDLAAQFSLYGSDSLRLAPKAVVEVFTKLMARLTGMDPWLPADTTCYRQPGYNLYEYDYSRGGYLPPIAAAAVDTADDVYLRRYTFPLTYLPSDDNNRGYNMYGPSDYFAGDVMDGASSGRPMGMPAPGSKQMQRTPENVAASAPLDKSTGGGGGGMGGESGSSVTIRVQDDFQVTPLFVNAKADASGRATFTFTAPQNLGSFALRAFAAVGDKAFYGSGEGKVVVKRRLSLTPSVPRFVRVGDSFEAGAVVTVGSLPNSVDLNLVLEDGSPLELTGPARKTATFAADGGVQQEVRFSFQAKAIGTAKITIAATLEGGDASDGLQLDLDVLGQQGDVWVATSFAIAANGSTAKWQEGMELPAAVPGSGGLALTAGIGYFPTIDSFYSSLQEQEKSRDVTQPTGPLALLWAMQPATFADYGRSPTANQSAAITRAFGDLATLTQVPALGLVYMLPGPYSDWPRWPDMWLNSWAVNLFERHAPAFAKSDPLLSTFESGWKSVSDLKPVWAAAVDTELVRLAEASRNAQYAPGPYSDWYTLALVRYVFGRDWTPATETSKQILADISFARLLAAAGNETIGLELEVRVMVALTLIKAGDASNPFVKATLDATQSRLRVQGRTAYVASTEGGASAADLTTQSLSLELLLQTSQTHLLVPKLAAYIANPFKRSGLYDFVYPPSSLEMALVSAVLSEYDAARGSTKPDLELLASSSNIVVLQASFTPASNAPVSNTTAWEDLASPPGPLQFQATGTGEVSIAASLHFVPAQLLPYPSYRGISVATAIQLLEPFTGNPTGRPLKTVPLSSVVAYTVQITSPDDLGPVTISVMMPGGLEPLDPNVPGSSGGINGPDSYCPIAYLSDTFYGFFSYWWWPICPTQETRPSVVTFKYAALMAGTSTVTVRAVAASVGSFVLPPVRAYADDQPEVMGMTAGGALTVCQGCQPEYAEAGPALKACPANCGGNGICNPIQGKCTCDSGYKGVDCTAAM